MSLPEEYISRMKSLLNTEFDDYIASFSDERLYGIRVNTLKTDINNFYKKGLCELEPVKWCKEGFYYNGADVRPSKSPYYHAGLYYLQEPSAMSTASVADIKPGERVLDVCAAPGGKSTQAGAKLNGKGILVTNDISTSRTKALLKNIELSGITNAIVLNETPEKIANRFPCYFDKIIIDAPCSGEGMFRKDPDIIKAWGKNMTDFCVSAQYEILESCAKAVCDGGYIIYSTCTFNPDENENQIDAFLECHSEFELCEIPPELGLSNGRPEWSNSGNPDLAKCGRIWPHKSQGEGHFVAKMHKRGSGEKTVFLNNTIKKIPGFEYFEEFIHENITKELNGDYETFDEKLYLVPKGAPSLRGMRIVRNGWHLGDIKKKRFEPSQAFAMGLNKSEVRLTEELLNYDTAVRYLKGESLETSLEEDGWVLVTFDGLTLGWAKSQKGRLKNKYLPGWKWE